MACEQCRSFGYIPPLPRFPSERLKIDNVGLVRDDSNLHADRLKLWEDFNICWLSVLQTQKEVTEQMQQSGRNPLPQQSVLSYEFMESMGKEIVRLCDIMEKHGLVDYQMGIWEEEIISSMWRVVHRSLCDTYLL